MKKCIFYVGLGVVSILFFNSCQKKDSVTPPETKSDLVTDYYPLSTGNYWVYKQTQYDSLGNVIPQTWKNDSIVVKSDTVINSKTYHTLVEYNFLGSSNPIYKYYRDSADCIVNNLGEVIFSINTTGVYKRIFTSDTVAYINYSYVNTPTNITVPQGTYNCPDFLGSLYRKMDNYNNVTLIHNYY